jgi:hypothetical protein
MKEKSKRENYPRTQLIRVADEDLKGLQQGRLLCKQKESQKPR